MEINQNPNDVKVNDPMSDATDNYARTGVSEKLDPGAADDGGDVGVKSREGINNTDVEGMPVSKKALNNPSGQDEGLSGYQGNSPLAD